MPFDAFYPRQRPTAQLAPLGQHPLSALSTRLAINGNIALLADTLYAHPMFLPSGGTVIRLNIVYTPSVNGRFGLYENAGPTTLYPAARRVDAGVLDGGGSPTFLGCYVTLDPGLYWLVGLWEEAVSVIGAIEGGGGHVTPYWLGLSDNLSSPFVGWTASRVYADGLPDPFPAGGTRVTAVPAIGYGLGE